jgi:hypothetical protein
MDLILDHAYLLFVIAVAVAVQWMAAYAGDFIRRRVAAPAEAELVIRRPAAKIPGTFVAG